MVMNRGEFSGSEKGIERLDWREARATAATLTRV